MKTSSKRWTILFTMLALAASLGLTACPEKEGPGERAGEAVDEAVGDTKRAVDDATD
jgi:hypothetical protein